MKTKIFCGSAKTITTKYGDLIKVSFSSKDLEVLQSNITNGWINLVIKEKQNKVEGKPTHYLEVDTFKPDSKFSNMKKEDIAHQSNIEDSDLPFLT
jgi:hypothetical protein